jgi:O-antigen ligase
MGVISLLAGILSVHQLLREGAKLVVHRGILAFCLLALLTVTVLTQSRSNLVALCIVAVILLSRFTKSAPGLLILFLLVVFLSPVKDRVVLSEKSKLGDKGSLLHRISIAYISYEIIKDYPVFGTGFGIQTFQNRKAIDPKAYNARLPKRFRMDEWGPKVVDLKGYTGNR